MNSNLIETKKNRGWFYIQIGWRACMEIQWNTESLPVKSKTGKDSDSLRGLDMKSL